MRTETHSVWLTAVFVFAVLLTSSVTAGTERSPIDEPKFATGPPGSLAASPEAVHQSDFLYPTFWVKSGTEKTYLAAWQNLESFTEEITNIYVDYLAGPGEWLIPEETSLSIASGEVAYVSFTFNPGGYINPPPGPGVAIAANVMIEAESMSDPFTWFRIRSVVADTVVRVSWDTIRTGLVGLTVSTNGNAGNWGAGQVNMDFVQSGLECDPDNPVNSVYLYDLTPIVMTDPETYSWQPYFRPIPIDNHFQPVAGYTQPEKTSDEIAEYFKTGTFVTSDSSIALEKTWIAPHEDVPFILEMLKVYSFDGLTHEGVWLGEWADWDAPADNATNNEGGLETFGGLDYLWLHGLTVRPEIPCLSYERRFGSSAMLGWYYDSDFPDLSKAYHSGPSSGGILRRDELFDQYPMQPYPDSVWKFLTTSGYVVHNGIQPDKIIVLGYGEFTIRPDDTLYVWTAHVSGYDVDLAGLSNAIHAAQFWYLLHRPYPAPECCFTMPDGRKGDVDGDGKYSLNDVTKLIDALYLGGDRLLCPASADTDCDCKLTLADITRLIGYIYIDGIPDRLCFCSESPPCPEF